MLNVDERAALLAVARDGLEVAVTGRPPRVIAGEHAGALAEDLACFVTLYLDDQLRGCIGMLEANGPLAATARAMAHGAALRDTRFRPVTAEELPRITLSVSVLSPPRPLRAPADWTLGRDGLIVSRGHNRGVLLPQVASDRGWDYETFVSHTSLKAGLPADAYRDPDAHIEVFSADVYQ